MKTRILMLGLTLSRIVTVSTMTVATQTEKQRGCRRDNDTDEGVVACSCVFVRVHADGGAARAIVVSAGLRASLCLPMVRSAAWTCELRWRVGSRARLARRGRGLPGPLIPAGIWEATDALAPSPCGRRLTGLRPSPTSGRRATSTCGAPSLQTSDDMMTVPEPEHHAERNLTPLAQVFSPEPSRIARIPRIPNCGIRPRRLGCTRRFAQVPALQLVRTPRTTLVSIVDRFSGRSRDAPEESPQIHIAAFSCSFGVRVLVREVPRAAAPTPSRAPADGVCCRDAERSRTRTRTPNGNAHERGDA
jgi:hypothetical protein